MKGSIVAFGNVLLDIITPVGQDLLSEYELQPDSTNLAEERHLTIFDKLQQNEEFRVNYSPGGCAANSVRVAQWVLGISDATIFVGAVGDDDESDKLLGLLREDGIIVKCQTVSNYQTGRCAVLTRDISRTLVTQLGASVHFSFDRFMITDYQYVIENAGVIYISGYFLRVCIRTVRKVIECASFKNIPTVLNLNAVWVVETFFDQIQEIISCVDYVIANELEAASMSKMLKLESTDLIEVGKSISKWSQCNEKFHTVLITRGSEPLIMVQGDQILQFPVVDVSNIIDTNGAGDGFAGGFLAGLLKQDPIHECIKCGLWAASKIIQQVGCNFSKHDVYTK